ncbi:MAG: hypothetical protein ACFFCI_14710 [Promethearchaeota archaeon]
MEKSQDYSQIVNAPIANEWEKRNVQGVEVLERLIETFPIAIKWKFN